MARAPHDYKILALSTLKSVTHKEQFGQVNLVFKSSMRIGKRVRIDFLGVRQR